MKEIVLDSFAPRDYQLEICRAVEVGGYKKLLVVWPRRAGKDIVAFNLMLRQALRKVGVYFYCLPTFRQARLVIWDTITIDGRRFLDFIPKELIKNKNNNEMKIKLINGSLIQLIGSDTYNTSLVGTNPCMVVFSEYALANPEAYTFVRPILNANDGIVLIASTPRGKNWLYELYEVAKELPDWFCQKLTLDETMHISWEAIKREIASGEISEDLAEQEYRCSFNLGVEGSYYAKYVDKMYLNNQITTVPWDLSKRVHTAWDLGVDDKTVVIFFSKENDIIRIIDYYEGKDFGLEHYIKVLMDKPYIYGMHLAPHDIEIREWAGGAITRREKARQLGIEFTPVPNIPVEDGIEAVRSSFSKIWIDENKCSLLIKAIENYRREYDSKKRVYRPKPLHDWASDACDCLRYLCVGRELVNEGTSPEEIDKRYREAMYNNNDNLPPFFR